MRSYLEHEDELVNQRTTWFVTLNSLLFAAIGLTFHVFDSSNQSVTLLSDSNYDLAAFLLISMPFVGLISSVITFRSVTAANNSAIMIDKKWDNFSSRYHLTSLFPALAAGGYSKIFSAGRRLGVALPFVMAPIWSLALLYALEHFLTYGHLEKFLFNAITAAVLVLTLALMLLLGYTLSRKS
jgi:hypothetical protein